MSPLPFAVVLNFRTPGETLRLVRSLQQDRAPLAGIIVVDNASGDGSAEHLRRTLVGVHVIAAATNGGFAAGCNLGIREARSRGAARVLLLNSDVSVMAGAIEALSRVMDLDARLGIVGPMLVSTGDDERIESLGIRYAARSGRMRHVGFGRHRAEVAPFGRRDVDGVTGCAMLVRREVFDAIGLLAETFFFGFEDLDFCLRARAAGFVTACIGAAVVRHQGSASIGRRSPRRLYFAVRNHLLLARRRAGPHRRLTAWTQTGSILALNLAHVLFTSDVAPGEGLVAFTAGVRDHFTRRYGADA